MRAIILDENNIVRSVRDKANVLSADETESNQGELGQRMLEDGTFEDVPVEPIESEPTQEELTQVQILLNTEMLLIYKEIEMEMI